MGVLRVQSGARLLWGQEQRQRQVKAGRWCTRMCRPGHRPMDCKVVHPYCGGEVDLLGMPKMAEGWVELAMGMTREIKKKKKKKKGVEMRVMLGPSVCLRVV